MGDTKVQLTSGDVAAAIDILKRELIFIGITDDWLVSTFLFNAMFGGALSTTSFGNMRKTHYGKPEYEAVMRQLTDNQYRDPYDTPVFEAASELVKENVHKWFGEACRNERENKLCQLLAKRGYLKVGGKHSSTNTSVEKTLSRPSHVVHAPPLANSAGERNARSSVGTPLLQSSDVDHTSSLASSASEQKARNSAGTPSSRASHVDPAPRHTSSATELKGGRRTNSQDNPSTAAQVLAGQSHDATAVTMRYATAALGTIMLLSSIRVCRWLVPTSSKRSRHRRG